MKTRLLTPTEVESKAHIKVEGLFDMAPETQLQVILDKKYNFLWKYSFLCCFQLISGRIYFSQTSTLVCSHQSICKYVLILH